VRDGWFKITITILGVICGVQSYVLTGGRGVDVGVGAHKRAESFTVVWERVWLVKWDTTYGPRGKVGVKDVSD
jgi:hypothetical protein